MKTAYQLIRERENEIPRNSDRPVWAQPNYTRYYNHVVPLKSGECRIDTYAVKTRNKRTGELAIKKVIRYRTDRKRYHVRDILYGNFMHYYTVNWCNEPFGRRHRAVWEDVDASIGLWGCCDYKWQRVIDLHGEWLNGFEGTRYAHCGYFCLNHYDMNFLDYAHCFNVNRGVEFLAKNGFWRFITPTFVTRLAENRDLFRFFRQHVGEMQKRSCTGGFYTPYAIPDLYRAYKDGTSVHQAHVERNAERAFAGLPLALKPLAVKYCVKNAVDPREYLEYIGYLRECGEDLNAYGLATPRDFRAAIDEYERRAHERRDNALALKRKGYNVAIKAVAADFAKLTRLSKGTLTVILPTSVRTLIREGNAMRNCIGRMGYDEKIATGKSLVVLLYRDGKPFVDIEIDRGTWTVRQCYAKGNTAPEPEYIDFAKAICRKAKAIYKQAA